jgi:pimeloyl-ACP methyl ester carboxylesterase
LRTVKSAVVQDWRNRVFELKHRIVQANGLRIHVAEQGEGPLVLLCHGFPETWYSWRHQLSALADAGFRAVAPDMRGYGETESPEAVEEYSLLHLVGDMVGLLDALGAETAVIAGHDWGAPVAWHAALLRPDRFRGVVGLCVPFIPRGQVYTSTNLPRTDDALFYQEYFQAPGVAEAEFERDTRFTVRSLLYTVSGDISAAEIAPVDGGPGMVSRQAGFLAKMINPPCLPPWISESDADVYIEQFSRSGYRGGLNWYRNISRNRELLAAFDGLKIAVPALYIVGDRDVVLAFQGMDKVIADLPQSVPLLQQTILLPGCGHWTQQERPEEVNSAILGFLNDISFTSPRSEVDQGQVSDTVIPNKG